jgi:hypothetical protein
MHTNHDLFSQLHPLPGATNSPLLRTPIASDFLLEKARHRQPSHHQGLQEFTEDVMRL